ncbi:MAG TPA: hypothetical protein PLS50_02080 [Candidatus Dojkabacteria bacterium]|nr:hypothetical protein [Candidatus Dojkabacteria bacterium]
MADKQQEPQTGGRVDGPAISTAVPSPSPTPMDSSRQTQKV